MKRALIMWLAAVGCGWQDIIPDPDPESIPPDAPIVVKDAPRDEVCPGWTQDGWPCEPEELGWVCHWSEGYDSGMPIPRFACSCDGQTWHCVEETP